MAHIPMGFANQMGRQVFRDVLIYNSDDNSPFGETVAEQDYIDFKADMLIVNKEPWTLQHIPHLALNFVPIVPLDHAPASGQMTSRLTYAFKVITISKFGQRELRKKGIESTYIPLGVRTDIFKPLPKAECKKVWYLDPEDFVVGIVAMNRARKMIVQQLRGYKRFCVLPRTGIRVNDQMVPIEAVTESQKVLTHTGNYKPVMKTMARSYAGGIVKLSTYLNNHAVNLTSEHRVLAIKTVKNLKCHKLCAPNCQKQSTSLKYFKKKDAEQVVYNISCLRKYYKNYRLDWIKAQDLEVGDVVVYPRLQGTKDCDTLLLPTMDRLPNHKYPETYAQIAEKLNVSRTQVCHAIQRERKGLPIKSDARRKIIAYFKQLKYRINRVPQAEIALTPSLMRYLGYYLAEGHTCQNKIVFTFNASESTYHADVIEIGKDSLQLEGIKKDYEYIPNATRIVFHSKQLSMLLQTLFGHNHDAKTKKLPQWFMYLPNDKIAELIKGWWRGDGCIHPVSFHMTTASYALAIQMRDLLLRLGIVASLATQKKGAIHVLRVSGQQLEKMSDILGVRHPFISKRKTTFQKFWVDNEYVYFPITKIESCQYNGIVHNLEVADDNTYVCEQIVVHNCDLNPDIKTKLFLWTNVLPSRPPADVSQGVADVGVNLLPEIYELGLGDYVNWVKWDDIERVGGIPDFDPAGTQDMNRLYSAFDVLLGTTGGEGFGLPYLEANAVGVPSIYTNYAAAAEAAGPSGIPVNAEDYVVINTPGTRYYLANVDGIAEALRKIYDADRAKLAKKCRAFAEKMSWENVIKDYWMPFLRSCEAELYPRITKDGTSSWAT